MSKLDIIALRGVVYKVKKHWSQHKDMWSWETQTKFAPGQIFQTNQKIYLLM